MIGLFIHDDLKGLFAPDDLIGLFAPDDLIGLFVHDDLMGLFVHPWCMHEHLSTRRWQALACVYLYSASLLLAAYTYTLLVFY